MDNIDFHQEEQKREPTTKERIFRAVGAILLIIGLLYLSGVYQFFFYQRTPASVTQPRIGRQIEGEIITVPLEVIILESEIVGSVRDRKDIERLVVSASNIWAQAGIEIIVRRIDTLDVLPEELVVLRRDPVEYLSAFSRKPGAVQAFFVHDLAGINGIAYGGRGTVALADHTSVFDFRVLAHEVGHVLGLGHVSDSSRLMFSGANGTELSLEEINRARAVADQLILD